MNLALPDFCDALLEEQRVVVCCHVSPDPDAIGSAAGLHNVCKTKGLASSLYLPGVIPENLQELLAGVDIVSELDSIPSGSSPLIIDTATKARSFVEDTFFDRFGQGKVFVVDHHASNPGWGTHNLIISSAAASASIVWAIASHLEVSLSPETADLLLAGLMDDTGAFRFSNADEESFLVAGGLVAAGARPERVANTLYFSEPERVIRLKSKAVETLQTHCEGRVASIVVTRSMLEECGASSDDSDGIVDIARSLRGVECAFFVRQRTEGWRVSLRAKNDTIDVNRVAQTFSGGGHRAAAGCTIVRDRVEDVLAALVTEIQQQLK